LVEKSFFIGAVAYAAETTCRQGRFNLSSQDYAALVKAKNNRWYQKKMPRDKTCNRTERFGGLIAVISAMALAHRSYYHGGANEIATFLCESVA
jgi:hypothetical protein